MFENRIYRRDELTHCELFKIRNGLLAINNNGITLDFAVLDHVSTDNDGDMYKAYWVGSGTSYLRELRHSYFAEIPCPWDDDKDIMVGYVFYLDHIQMKEALDVLGNFFDP